jgi:hypothetical protein
MLRNNPYHRDYPNKKMQEDLLKANKLIRNANNLKKLTKSQSLEYFSDTFRSSLELSSELSVRNNNNNNISYGIFSIIYIINCNVTILL